MQQSVERAAEVHAWAGSWDDVALLLNQLRLAFASDRTAAETEVEVERQNNKNRGLPQAVFDDRASDALRRVDLTFTERVVATDKRTDVQSTGSLDEIRNSVSAKDLDMLTISYPNNGYASARSARLRFSQWGLSCSVRGRNQS